MGPQHAAQQMARTQQLRLQGDWEPGEQQEQLQAGAPSAPRETAAAGWGAEGSRAWARRR